MKINVIVHSLLILLVHLIVNVHGKKHHLVLKNDVRRFFKVSSFGFVFGGTLHIHVREFSFKPPDDNARFGFTIARTMSDSLTPYIEKHERGCSLYDDITESEDNIGLITLVINIKQRQVIPDCSPALRSIALSDNSRRKRGMNGRNSFSPVLGIIPPNQSNLIESRADRREEPLKHQSQLINQLPVNPQAAIPDNSQEIPPDSDKNQVGDQDKTILGGVVEEVTKTSCEYLKHPIKLREDRDGVYSFDFRLDIARLEHEGLYSVFFQSCQNYEIDEYGRLTRANLTLDIVERNLESYLSAGEIPLPELYFALSVIFFILGLVWLQILRSKRHEAFKIHYLMAALVFVKSLALLFHGINYHFISTEGSQIETWAILYYITHLLKGALLFITIVLIGTGWAFVKPILSEKDKNLFVIVIPLQVLANIAEIITEASEEGAVYHNKWREIFILVDLLCCGAILFPVVWSIRHLQEAAHVDGKAATNLKKLKLFRRFYVIVVCYIYFTRIIVYLLRITLPFQYEWMDVFCQHAAIFVFFVLTGYHFQPTPQNPYFRVAQDDDLEMEEVLFEVTPNTYIESLSKVNRKSSKTVEVDVDDREQLIRSRDFD